jgi:hypothetical protein
MFSIYTFIADPEWAEILTLITMGLLAFAWMSFIWGNAKRLNKRISTFDTGLIYLLGIFTFLCGVIALGKFIVPKNADSLLETLRIYQPLRYITIKFQAILLSIIRPML